jgi:predicted MFS family arabinose efflux permease
MTKTLHLSEEFFGFSNTLLSLGSAIACLFYSFYCRRLSMRLMVPLSIASGIVSNLVYFLMTDKTSAAFVSMAVGFTYMSANMIQCDLAARVCPTHAAGTTFAVLMALCNIATDLSMWLGGMFYESIEKLRGSAAFAFQVVLVVGAALILGSWVVARLIPSDD